MDLVSAGLSFSLYWLALLTIVVSFTTLLIYIFIRILASKSKEVPEPEPVEIHGSKNEEELELAAAVSAITYYLGSTHSYEEVEEAVIHPTPNWKIASMLSSCDGGE